MSKRLLIVLFTLMFPFAATADTTAPPTDNTASSAGLGPQASGGTGSSNADSTALQPAGTSPIQSTTGDAAGLTAPSSVLQAPATGDSNLQVLAGEVDGATHQADETQATPWSWIIFTLVIALAVG